MTVYVDDAYIPYGRMKMCHMVADTEEELHEVADKIGMKREWFQDKSMPHYDVGMGKRALAVEQGAVEITMRELIALKERWMNEDLPTFRNGTRTDSSLR